MSVKWLQRPHNFCGKENWSESVAALSCPRVHNSRRLLFRVRQEEGGIKWQNFFHYTTQMERSCVGCVNLSTVPHNLDRDSTAVMLTVTHTANANRGSHVVIVRIILRSPKRMES